MCDFIVKKIIRSSGEGQRSHDIYLFDTSIEEDVCTICIGENPSANNTEFLDKTNMRLINQMYNSNIEKFKKGYHLLNLSSIIDENSGNINASSKRNDELIEFLKAHADYKIILFYGPTVCNDKKYLFTNELLDILDERKDNLYVTKDKDDNFRHPSISNIIIKKIKETEKFWPEKHIEQ